MTDAKKQDHFCRLHLLSTIGVTPVLAKVVESICAKTCNGDVVKFLDFWKKKIIILKKKKTINAAAYEKLFPQNVKTDINAWDISLLTCILLNFCMLEERCNKEKLINLFEQELVIQNTDINTHLAANRGSIDQNVRKQLSDEQYKQIYPNSGVTVDIKALDLEVLLILLANCSTGVRNDTLKDHIKPLIIQEIELSQFNRDLNAFLKKHYQRLTDLQKNGIISDQQYEQLFPGNTIFPDINTWDQCLLIIIVNNICPHLKHSSANAIRKLRTIRNEKFAHASSHEITEEDFESLWTDIIIAIQIVIENEVEGYTVQQWNNSISQIKSGPLNKEHSIDIVKEWYQGKDITNENLEEMRLAISELALNQKQGLKEVNEKLEKLSDKKPDVYKVQEEIQCIDVRIVIKGNDATAVKKAHYLIKQAMDAEVDISKKDDAVRLTLMKIKEVSIIKKEVTKEGSVIVAILEGSIILRIRCHTLLELHYLLRYEGKLEMKNHFDKLAEAVGRIVGETIEITSGITEYSLKELNDKVTSICLKNDVELSQLRDYEEQQSLEETTGSEDNDDVDKNGVTPQAARAEDTTTGRDDVDTTEDPPQAARFQDTEANESGLTEEMEEEERKRMRKFRKHALPPTRLTRSYKGRDDVDTTEDPPQAARFQDTEANESGLTEDMEEEERKRMRKFRKHALPPTRLTRSYKGRDDVDTTEDPPQAARFQDTEANESGLTEEMEEEERKRMRKFRKHALPPTRLTRSYKVFRAEKIGTYKIRCPEDKSRCDVRSCVVLQTGYIVVCDENNSSIKLFDETFSKRDALKLEMPPWDSCVSLNNNTHVLVTIPDKMSIYTIKVTNGLKKINKIRVGGKCHGLTRFVTGIAVTVKQEDVWEIHLLQYDGKLMNRIRQDTTPRLELKWPDYMTTIDGAKKIIISDQGTKCLTAIDVETGRVAFVYKDLNLRGPENVTSDNENNIYVADSESSRTVCMISRTGQTLGVILTAADGLMCPRGLCYNKRESRLLLQPDKRKPEMCKYNIVRDTVHV